MNWLSGLLLCMIVGSASADTHILDIAHRGYAAVNPESTMVAFRNAHAQGADGIEFDVRQTKDGVLVVAHDPHVDALRNHPIEYTTFSDLHMVTDIPSLEEVLIFAKQSGQTVWLEIKQSHRYPRIIDKILALIVEYALEDFTVIQSFNHNDLNIISQKNPHIRLLALYSSNFSLQELSPYLDYVGLPISEHYLDTALIRGVHRLGKQVIFWRKNQLSESRAVLQKFIDAGADGFMLDQPLKRIMQLQ